TSRDAFAALDETDQALVVGFLESLGGFDPKGQVKVVADADLPDLGEPGGPTRALSGEEASLWERGRAVFDRSSPVNEGLGPLFNGDSCRACHQDPVLGGAGGIDTNVLRFGRTEADGSFTALDRAALPRGVIPGEVPFRLPDEANTVEFRNPPTSLGVGLVDGIAETAILAIEDPDDLDADGISGRARLLAGGQVGRFGWKAQVPTVADFAADALLNEMGLTIDLVLSQFTAGDDDGVHDPDLDTASFEALVFYLSLLAPPARMDASDPEVIAGETHFASFGCDACHLPELDGVQLFSDLLLHDIAADDIPLVDQEGVAVLPTEFRTPPLWGVRDTPPYLHHGQASTLDAAIRDGHFGEGEDSRSAYEASSPAEQAALLRFLESL
ncbi:MAG: hypothetical protein JRJ84_23905, partial [Deltaproteobacteria bacterium]|nr:hypothetical protein [Deltaproteobacteria bacterium]